MAEHKGQSGWPATETLAALGAGERAVIHSLRTGDRFRRRLLDLGFVPGTVVEAVRKSPGGDPVAVNVRGAVIALRLRDAGRIAVRRLKGSNRYADDG